MLDLRFVVANLDEVKRRLSDRGAHAIDALAPIEKLAAERRDLIQSSETQRAEQKKASEQMRTLKGEEQAQLRARLKTVSDEVKAKEARLKEVEEQIESALLNVPNLPHATVPVGKDEKDNQVVREWGTRPSIASAREHTEIGEKLGMLDFERAAKVSGARFVFLKGALAQLELALVRFFLDSARERGYIDLLPPYLVNADSMQGTGQLPKFEDDLFKTQAPETTGPEPAALQTRRYRGLYLIPTAEVPVTNYHRDEILDGADLPLKYCAFSPCFRSEAGSYGKDTKGIIRQHQFHKVELVRFEKPEQAHSALEELVKDAQAPLQKLNLHHRVVALCTADLGFSSEKTYDLEVWLPGQNAYREISSCSTFGEYQARRARIRYRPTEGDIPWLPSFPDIPGKPQAPKPKGKPRLVATLNGSGLAVGRTVVAILENGQQPDGTVLLPDAIHSYMGVDRLMPLKRGMRPVLT
ncbi:MAG: serine--tRNA ligase [Myxococcales bacterium]|nr:serine--tRNA ligase [Myxococcales bacterium]